ncbi:hypothetical protein ONA24_05570 [Mycoplasmopsis cynos]|nr:hypothetical protein [Mycoplasmopsis cynos]WAM09462.1 hypothetical protein ONA24_05570 [Mycoplasmopsis cynos]
MYNKANKVIIIPLTFPSNLIEIYEIHWITEAPGSIFVTITIWSNSLTSKSFLFSTISFFMTGVKAFPPPKLDEWNL